MSNLYESFGETVKALYYKNEADKAKKEVVGPHKANELENLQMDYAGKQKQSQINKLAKDNEIKKIELQEKELSLQRKNILLVALALGIFFFGTYRFYDFLFSYFKPRKEGTGNK
jgi:hypothetical protein